MNFNEALQWRYATKKFDPTKSIDESVVTQLLEAANLSATSYGLQPFQLVVVQNQKLQDGLIASSYGQRQVADASHVIVIAARTDINAQYISDYVDFTESERGLETGAMDDYKAIMTGSITGMSDDAMEQWTAKQTYIVLGTLLAACGMHKIDACPMEGFVPSEYDEALGLAERNLTAVLVVPIGIRAEDDINQNNKKVRRPLSQMVVRI